MANKSFSLINILGLAIGLTCFILIAAFVFDELSYDRYPAEAENIYRVNLSVTGNGNVAVYPHVDVGVGEGMKAAFPEIRATTRMLPVTDFVKYNDQQFKENKLAFADSNFLQLFSIPLKAGSETGALVEPNSIVISKALAQKYFGGEDPLGKSLVVGIYNAAYKVTGVFEKIPDESHFHFDAVMSLSTFKINQNTWSNIGYYTYLLLDDQADPKELEPKFRGLVAEHVVPEVQRDMGISLAEAQKAVNTFVFSLQPLTSIHLRSHTTYELEPNGDLQYVYIFSALALFVLLLACINFTNLSTARAVKRTREVGIRKVMGSAKFQLIRQFLSESVLLSSISMVCALGLVYLLLPYFNQVSGKNIGLDYFLTYRFGLAAIALVLAVGILAGIYPAFFLSSFSIMKVLKGATISGSHRKPLQSSLVVFQFFISTALIIATLVVYQQLNYMQNKKLGYTKEEVLFLPDARLLTDKQDAFRDQLLQDNRVVSASIARVVPGNSDFIGGTEIFPKDENGKGTEIHANIYRVDYDYINTLDITLAEGRYFSQAFRTDSSAVVINEAAAAELGWNEKEAVGKSIVRSGQQEFKVIGVVHDFNYASTRQKVAPLMLMLGGNYGGLVLKIKTTDVKGFLNDLESRWNAFNPAGPIEYHFLDESFAALYTGEVRTQKIFTSFAILAVIIACLGLFGLSAFVVEQRTREIGIRKVLGASVENVLMLVVREFILLVVIAFVISIPVTWWAMDKWLEDFAYRVNLSWWVFAAAGAAAVMIALLTISFQSLKAAFSNPLKSLRSE